MTLQTKAFIKERLLAGYVVAEIAKDLPRFKPSTVNTYTSKVRAELTLHEREIAKKAKKSRLYVRGFAEATRAPIGAIQWKIGITIARFRTERFLTVKEFCNKYSFGTMNSIRKMERGDHDFTMRELEYLSNILNISSKDLFMGSF